MSPPSTNGDSQRTWGAIFDLDGVIIDSSPQHEESWNRLAREVGLPLPADHFKRGFGRKNEVIIPGILEWTSDPAEISRLSLRKEALYREVVKERSMAPLPGVGAWLQRLADAGIPRAVGSSTHRANVEIALEMTGLGRFFTAIISSEDVKEGKPHPDVFLRAAERIARSPQCCVVFEDAHAGIEAARNGGMKVVALATTNRLEELGAADLAVSSFEELDLAAIDGLFGLT